MRTIQHFFTVLLGLLVLTQATSCRKDEEEVLASFTFKVDAADFQKVVFTNASQNYSALSWNFGDNSSSTETNPTHTYATTGDFTVTLTATSLDGESKDIFTAKVTVADPDAELGKLTGTTTKTWKLLRDVSTGRYPLEVGPIDRSTIWWAQGKGNDELANRPCILNDEYTFGRDKSFVYATKGDFWAEGGVFDPSGACFASTPENMKGPNGEDLSAFGDGNHTFTMNTAALTVVGTGAFIGLPKIATGAEVKLPQSSVTLNIVKLTDDVVDTLILETTYKSNATVAAPDAYWRIVLVHYDNPSDEPEIPGPAPAPAFTTTVSGKTVSFTNTSTNATSYSWDFGDGNTSSASEPSHTYTEDGVYVVKLTAMNGSKTAMASQDVIIGSSTLTNAALQGGAWKVRKEANSVVVGPGMGNGSWWQLPKDFLTGAGTGSDDWSCLADDEFIFSSGGVYEYKTNGSARNDGYFGGTNGCIDDATIAASGNGAAFGSGVHSYTFTDAASSPSGRPIITLTNGGSKAAFIGFYKGYYGGENSNSANVANGGSSTNPYEVIYYIKSSTKEYLFVSVDISGAHDGSASWSVVLVR